MAVAFAGSVEKESGSLATGATTTQTTATWTPGIGDVIVVKVSTKTNTITAATPVMTGMTFTALYSRATISGAPAMYTFIGQVRTLPGTVAVSVNITNASGAAGGAHIVAERFTGAALPTNAVGSTAMTSTSSATTGLTGTITQGVAGSMLSWTVADGAGQTGTPTYSTTTSTPTASQNYQLSGVHSSYSCYQGPISTTGSKTFGVASFSSAASRKLVLMAVEIPPAPLAQTLTETFAAALSTTRFPTQNGFAIDATYGCGSLAASHTNGTPSYSALRSAPIYQLQESWIVLQVPLMPQAPGENANFQFWMSIEPGSGVNRIGFEYVASANRLDLLGQTTNYASIGTTVSLTYSRTHQWLRLAMTGTTITWQTSPDGFSWVTQRTLTGAPTWTTQANLLIDVECFRSSGNNSTSLFDNLNLPNSAAGVPRWIISTNNAGVVTWAAVETATDVVAADYQNADYNRQTSLGNGAASGLTWPVPVVPAPWGRTGGRAALVRLPDNARRNEIMPDVAEWADGEMWWEGFAFALDADTDLNATGYQVIWQSRPDDDRGSPPCSIEVFKGAIKVTGGYNRPTAAYGTAPTSGSTYSYETTIIANPVKQKWYHVVICYGVWSALNSGCFAVNIDGTWVYNGNPVVPGTNYPYNGSKTYVKCGLYHDAANRGATIYISDHKIGTGFAAVNPARTIDAYGGQEMMAPRKA